jgi:hypothetical protein
LSGKVSTEKRLTVNNENILFSCASAVAELWRKNVKLRNPITLGERRALDKYRIRRKSFHCGGVRRRKFKSHSAGAQRKRGIITEERHNSPFRLVAAPRKCNGNNCMSSEQGAGKNIY